MTEPPSPNSSNQFDTSSDSQSSPNTNTPSSSPPPTPKEVVFTPKDMATGQFTKYPSGINYSVESTPLQPDE